MEYQDLGASGRSVSRLVLGVMRIDQLSDTEIRSLVATARDEGITMFDHADIYGGDHLCERRFSQALRWSAAEREQVVLQSKVGIRQWGWFDFSAEHIVSSVEESLRALNTDYLDVVLLHRPDALCEPEEVAKAFDLLYESGKVRHVGVSNHSRGQLELLRAYVRQPLVANQLQFSVTHARLVAEGVALNMEHPQSVSHTGEVLDYCRATRTTVQAWSPMQSGDGSGPFIDNTERFAELNEVLSGLTAEYGVTPDAVATAWILRHPARMQVVVGSTRAERIRAACAGSGLTLTREQWYEVFRAAGYTVP